MLKSRKKIIIFFLILVGILVLIKPTNVWATDKIIQVKFNDENLYNAIIKQIDDKIEIQNDDTSYSINIKEEDIATITKLELNNSEITDISGIENFTDIIELDLSNNIEDISKLQDLTKLTNLQIYGCNISDIRPLNKLINLETLNLSKNKLGYTENVSYIGQIPNLIKLKQLDMSHNYIKETKGLEKFSELIELNLYDNAISDFSGLNGLIKLENLNIGENNENGKAYVTYDDFGARGDGVYDDFIAIRNAHLFANENGCEVRANAEKTYHIYKYYDDAVTIKTNTNWNGAKFVIHDEKIEQYSGRYKNIFIINNINNEDIITINNPSWTIGTNTKRLIEIDEKLKRLNDKGYKKYLCIAINNKKKQFIRFGVNNESGESQQDYFTIDSNGNVLNDIQWDFEQLTSMKILPIPNSDMEIKNGNFISNAIESKSETTYKRANSGKRHYFSRNIYINQCANIDISNIYHTLENDDLSGSYWGLIYGIECADMDIKDCTLE